MAAPSLDPSGTAPSRRGWWIAGGVVAGIALILVLFVYLFDHSRRDVIANGVRIDGIAVGGLHRAAAEQKLEQDLVTHLKGPVTIHSGTHTWTLNGSATGLQVDVDRKSVV